MGSAVRCAAATLAATGLLVAISANAPVAGTPTRPPPTFPVTYHAVMPEDLGR